eukprot:SAG25_NODE_6529_length_552_cov_3.262693_1_plen_45_part_10
MMNLCVHAVMCGGATPSPPWGLQRARRRVCLCGGGGGGAVRGGGG